MSKSVPARVSAPRNVAMSRTTKDVVARVQSAVARNNEGSIPKGSYVGRMQRVVADGRN